jgi:hypothetical protein
VKVQFYDQETGYENIWALPLGDGTYCLENPPFFIYDISLHDIVAAVPDENGVLQFLSIVARSGNKTLRARSDALLQSPMFRSQVKAELLTMGCCVEEHRHRLLSISVPSSTDMAKVIDYLTTNRLSWEYGCPSGLNT